MTGYCQVYLPLSSENAGLMPPQNGSPALHAGKVIPVNNISSNSLFLYHCTISMRIITRTQIKNIWNSFSFGQFWLKTENESQFLSRFYAGVSLSYLISELSSISFSLTDEGFEFGFWPEKLIP